MIRLVPLTEPLLQVVNSWRAIPDFGGEFDWYGVKRPLTIDDLKDDRRLVIFANEIPVGEMSFHDVHYGPNQESTAFNFGIGIHSDYRGRGIGTEAQRLIAELLLERVNRVEAQTDVRNVAEQRSLEKAGFTREGVLHGAQFRNGAYHDLVSYSKTRIR